VFVLKDRNELEVDYYGRLEEVVELQYHSEQNNVFIIVLKPDLVIDSVKWSGHGSDGLTRVNPKKKHL